MGSQACADQAPNSIAMNAHPAFDGSALQDAVRNLSKVSNLRAMYSIIRQWIVIAGVMACAMGASFLMSGSVNPARGFSDIGLMEKIVLCGIYLMAILVIATRQHALGVIMHDATHYRLFTNRRVNDIASDLFCAFPIGLSTSLYRFQHLVHHRHVNTERDPYWTGMNADKDWIWPKSRAEAIR